jgi:uncharacterized DUF497 family protein
MDYPTDPPAGFSWGPAANERCVREYGFSFFELVHVFEDERYDYLDLGEHLRDGEARRVIIGRMPWGLIVAVVYTVRDGRKRLIWVRPARRGERKAFNEHNGLTDERPRIRHEPPA